MAYDYSKLIGLIVEKFGTQLKFAEVIGLSERSVSLKLNNKRPWTQKEISKASELLDIDPEKINEYFFNYKVQQN